MFFLFKGDQHQERSGEYFVCLKLMLLAQQCQKWDFFPMSWWRQVVETDQGIKVVVDSKAVWCPTAWHRADRATQNEWVMISWLFS